MAPTLKAGQVPWEIVTYWQKQRNAVRNTAADS